MKTVLYPTALALGILLSALAHVDLTLATGCAVPSFADALAFDAGSAPFAVAVGDLNGDGKLDLTVATFRSDFSGDLDAGVWVLLSNRKGSFEPAVKYEAGSGPRALAVGDLNGDGKPDIAVASLPDSTISVFVGQW